MRTTPMNHASSKQTAFVAHDVFTNEELVDTWKLRDTPTFSKSSMNDIILENVWAYDYNDYKLMIVIVLLVTFSTN